MEEDIKILEEFIDGLKQYNPKTGKNIEPICFGGGQRYVYKNVYYAIHHLIKAYRENEAVIKEMVEHIASSAIIDDMVCMYKDCDREECDNNISRECTEQYFRKKVRDERNKV